MSESTAVKTLINRIDTALAIVGMSRRKLAEVVDVSPQAFTNLSKRPGATMRPEKVAQIARALRCDFYWLCTGIGGEYVPEINRDSEFSAVARQAASWLDAMPEDARMRAYGILHRITRGDWPTFPDPAPADGHSLDGHTHADSSSHVAP